MSGFIDDLKFPAFHNWDLVAHWRHEESDHHVAVGGAIGLVAMAVMCQPSLISTQGGITQSHDVDDVCQSVPQGITNSKKTNSDDVDGDVGHKTPDVPSTDTETPGVPSTDGPDDTPKSPTPSHADMGGAGKNDEQHKVASLCTQIMTQVHTSNQDMALLKSIWTKTHTTEQTQKEQINILLRSIRTEEDTNILVGSIETQEDINILREWIETQVHMVHLVRDAMETTRTRSAPAHTFESDQNKTEHDTTSLLTSLLTSIRHKEAMNILLDSIPNKEDMNILLESIETQAQKDLLLELIQDKEHVARAIHEAMTLSNQRTLISPLETLITEHLISAPHVGGSSS